MRKDSNAGVTSSTAQQEFQERVGTVAGRDAIDNSKHNEHVSTGDGSLHITGDRATVIQIGRLLNSLTESTLQANFYAATGIRCGPKIRATMEYLMEKHDFTSYELGRAWNTNSLVKEGNGGNLKGSAIFLSLAMGWLGAIGATAYGLFFLAVLIFSYQTMSGVKIAALSGLLFIVFLGGLSLFIHTFLKPTYVAKRVIKVLQESPPPFFAAKQSE